MIRPFQLRDWGRLRRLSDNSVPLNASLILTFPTSPLRGAVAHRLFKRNFPTFMWRDAATGARAFVQVRLSKDRTQAHVLWVGSLVGKKSAHSGQDNASQSPNGQTETTDHQNVWQSLFDELGQRLAMYGVHNLIAEAREDSAEATILREVGFANYSRQDIYKLESWQPNSNSVAKLLSPRRRSDDWDIELLYAHTVPNMIRLIEPHPPIDVDSWVYYEDNELVAFANHKVGRAADWLQLQVKLEMEASADQLVRDAVIFKPPSKERPLYCNVRHYQDWLGQSLQNNGFRPIGSQVVMVRHTVQQVKQRVVSSLEEVLQTGTARVNTTPYVQKAFGTEQSVPHQEPNS